MHPTELVEGGLSQVEERVLLELPRAGGAWKVVVHVGPVLDDAGVNQKLNG
jgi:hypothetical protein